METAVSKYSLPDYLYEEVSVILISDRDHKSIRKLRRYFRSDSKSGYRHLLIYDHPEEMEGTAFLYDREADEALLFMPAFADIKKLSTTTNFPLPGTDFLIRDWEYVVDTNSEYRYGDEVWVDHVNYQKILQTTSSKDEFVHWVALEDGRRTRVDRVNKLGRVVESIRFQDINVYKESVHLPSLILKRSELLLHQSLFKVTRRVLSRRLCS